MLVSLSETEDRDLLEIIHIRHKRESTILYSQFEPVGWLSKFPEATIADAILDRIVHDSYTIEIRSADMEHQGSMREIYGLKAEKSPWPSATGLAIPGKRNTQAETFCRMEYNRINKSEYFCLLGIFILALCSRQR